jgi:hypothetical protein
VAVPEATVYKYDGPETGKNDVWLSRQFLGMDSVAKPGSMQCAPQTDFRRGIDSTDAGHHP